jgi:hypothetical protein
MSEMLSGKGLWATTEERAKQAIRQAPLMGATHVLAKVGDTFTYQGVLQTRYYSYATPMRQRISAAGLVPMAWIFIRLLHPEEEARLIVRAFADGYQGVILDVEDQCDGKADEARRLVEFALMHGVDPYRVYNCSFPNIYDHGGLPYGELNALCKGGLMPMAYAIFYVSDTAVPPAEQAATVIDDWTYAQYEQFYGSLSYKPPMYPVLGPFHERPQLRLLTAAEFRPWLDRLAAHEPTFFSIYASHVIDAGLYPLIRDFRLGETSGDATVITQKMWGMPLQGIVLRASPGGAPSSGVPYRDRRWDLVPRAPGGRHRGLGWRRAVGDSAPRPLPGPGAGGGVPARLAALRLACRPQRQPAQQHRRFLAGLTHRAGGPADAAAPPRRGGAENGPRQSGRVRTVVPRAGRARRP